MTEWREFKIKDIGTVITGTTPSSKIPEYFGTDIPFVTPTDFKYYFKYCDRTDRFLSKIGADKYKNRLLPPQSVLVTCIGSDMGKVAISKEVVITNQQINSIIVSSEFSSDFVYYSLIAIYDTLRTYGQSGTAVPIVNKTDFENITLLIPPLPEQKAIAEVLSSLDDKIDLLTRQNKTLEDLAQTYFRKWFVEDSSDDWDVGKAEDYFEIGIGKTPPRKEHKWFTNNPNDKVWISIADMGKSGLFIGDSSEYLTSEAVERFNIRRVPKGSILLSFKLTVGRVAVALCELTTNEAIAHFKYKEAIYREYLYCYLKSFDYNSLGSTSSIATAINSTIIKEMPFVMPDKCKLTKFHELTAPIFRKIETNILQMTTLQKLRDTLLPKLISGEVRVKQ